MTGVAVNWTAPRDTSNGPIDGYFVDFKEEGKGK